jgi:hypothetical protein
MIVDRKRYCEAMLQYTGRDETLLHSVTFSDVATLHRKQAKLRVRGIQPSQEIIEHRKDMPNVNVWCGMKKYRIIGPFFFQEATVISHSYLDILENGTVPQLPCDSWLQQNGEPPNFGKIVHRFLNEPFRNKWIGRGGFLTWPPRSPYLTPLGFFLWAYVRNIIRRKFQISEVCHSA